MRTLRDLNEKNIKKLTSAQYSGRVNGLEIAYELLKYCFNDFILINTNKLVSEHKIESSELHYSDLLDFQGNRRSNIKEIREKLISVLEAYITIVADEVDTSYHGSPCYEKTGKYCLVYKAKAKDGLPNVICNKLYEICHKFSEEDAQAFLALKKKEAEEKEREELLNSVTATNYAILSSIE